LAARTDRDTFKVSEVVSEIVEDSEFAKLRRTDCLGGLIHEYRMVA
jgi:hypothetical protein